MIRFAVCDDEPFMLKEISDRISQYMGESPCTVQCFASGRLLLESDCDFDLIFLDIQMEHPDGMETAKTLRQRGMRALLVFVTVLEECVFDAFAVEAFDYLVKPLEDGRFRQTMDRALKALEQRAEKNVFIRRGNSCEIIPLAQIVYCEVQGRKLFLHQADGKSTGCYEKLNDFVQRVDGRFFRCHRSYLVNLDCVRSCGGGRVKLSSGDEIPVSRLRERDFSQALLRHMRERGN